MLDAAGLGGCGLDFFLATRRDASTNLGHAILIFASRAAHRAAFRRLSAPDFAHQTGLALHASPMWLHV